MVLVQLDQFVINMDFSISRFYLWFKILFMSKARNEYKGIITHKCRYLDLYYIHPKQFGIQIQLTSSYVILIWEWKEFCHLIKLYTNQVDVVPLCIVTSPFLLIFELSHVPCLFGAICQQMPSIQNLPLKLAKFSMQLLFVFWYH